MKKMKVPSDEDWRFFFNVCYEEYLIDLFIEEIEDDDPDGWFIIEDDPYEG